MRLAAALLCVAACAQVPEFVHGDECLFCHRNTTGPTWQKNAHGLAMRQKEDAPELIKRIEGQPYAAAVTHTLGSRNHVRYLKQNGYGKVDLLENGVWKDGKFGPRCAGCHATAVDPKTQAYAAIGIDCYACHGVVDLEHSSDVSKIFLSKKRRSDAIAVTNACAQCHLRGAISKSTGLPYPALFTAGDDLWKDLEADWSKASVPAMNPGDRHVWISARDVIQNGSETTCISCHRHQNSSERHRRVLSGPICLECHNAEGPKKAVKKYEVHSAVCEY